jgi:hypothetical protein
MEFNDRKVKCKRIQKTDLNGNPLPEVFYALITDEVTQEGTPLNAEAMNKGNWRDDETVSFKTKGIDTDVNAESNVTKIYTDEFGETWIVPPATSIEPYRIGLGSLRDPTTGQKNYLQSILSNSHNIFTRPCTAKEYDDMNLARNTYDVKNIKALDFDICGKLMLTSSNQNFSGYSIFDLRDPTTGQKDFLQNILSNLFSLIAQMSEPFTAEEFDFFTPGITRDLYEKKDITAINFDMRGKSFF